MSHMVAPQQRENIRREPRWMPKFHRMAVRLRQQFQEGVEPEGIVFQERRQLPEDHRGLLSQWLDSVEKPVQRSIKVNQLLHMGDETAAFHRIHESVRRFVAPPCYHPP